MAQIHGIAFPRTWIFREIFSREQARVGRQQHVTVITRQVCLRLEISERPRPTAMCALLIVLLIALANAQKGTSSKIQGDLVLQTCLLIIVAAINYWATCTGDQEQPVVSTPHFGLALVECTPNDDGSLHITYTVVFTVLITNILS
jgi:hypothetical protein